jgi:hypothetical protein
MVEGTRWRQKRRSRERQRVCGREIIGLGFRGSGTLKKKNSSDEHDDVINARHYCACACHYKLLKNRVYNRLIIRYITQYMVEQIDPFSD